MIPLGQPAAELSFGVLAAGRGAFVHDAGATPRLIRVSCFHFVCSAESLSIREYASELMPGLMQTEAYYRACLATDPTAADAEQMVGLRRERQARFSEEDWSYRAVLNEAVVRRPVGGSAVMRDQLTRLLELAGRPNVTLQVLPFAVGVHPAMAGSFTLLQFQGAVPDIAFVEHQAGSLYLDNGDEAPYVRMYEDLTGMASSPADSAAFIRDVRASLP